MIVPELNKKYFRQFQHQLGIKMPFLVIILLIALILSGCEVPESFKGLRWNITLNVPLMNKIFPIYDLENGETFFIEDSLLIYYYTNEIESQSGASIFRLRQQSSAGHQLFASEEGIIIGLSIDETGISDDDIEVTYALVSEGSIYIEVVDVINELQELRIEFSDILTTEGTPFTTVINDFTDSIHSFDVAGYYIGNEGADIVIDSLNFYIEPISEPVDDALARVRIFFAEPIYFDYLRGYLVNKRVNLQNRSYYTGINYPYSISKAISLEEAFMKFSFTNELGFDAQFVGTLVALNHKDNIQETIHITENDNLIIRGVNVPGEIEITERVFDNPETINFINVFAEEIRIQNAHLIIGNKDDRIGFAHSYDTCYGNFQLSASSVVWINNATIIPDTVYSIVIDKDNRDYIEKYPESVTLSFDLENTTPLGAIIDIFFSSSPDTLHLFHPPPDTVHSIIFSNNYIAPTNDINGQAINQIEFCMKRQDIELFLNEEVYFALKITFDNSHRPVHIRPEQYLKIIGRLSIRTHIDISG